MSLLAIILIVILLGFGFPYAGRPAYWGGGWYAGGGLGLVFIVLLVLLLAGRI